jgi:hypothetical protein
MELKKTKKMRTTRSAAFIVTLTMLLTLTPTIVKAQDNVEASLGADIVSSYIWRGIDCGGVSIQPSASVAYKGLSLGAWASVGLEAADTKELDFTLSYATGGLSIAVTDYWFYPSDEASQVGYFTYDSDYTQHLFEGTIAYDFGAIALSWNTNFAGNDYRKACGDIAYSTYIGASVPFTLGGIEWAAELGLTPWEGAYADKLNITNLSLVAAKEIPFSDSFALPVFGQISFNPYTQGAYFAFGVSF